jgi:hypothetical protein
MAPKNTEHMFRVKRPLQQLESESLNQLPHGWGNDMRRKQNYPAIRM